MIKDKNKLKSVWLLYPINEDKLNEELKKENNYKWLVMILDKRIYDSLRKTLENFVSKRIVIIDGDLEMKKFFGINGSLMSLVSRAIISNSMIHLRVMEISNKNKKSEIYIVYCGMEENEVLKYYDKFVKKLRILKSDIKDK